MPGFVWVGAGMVMGAWVLTVLKLMDALDDLDRERLDDLAEEREGDD